MGLCENLGGWRWQSSSGGFRGGVGVMLVLLLLLGLSWAQSNPPQTACESATAPQSLTQPDYLDTVQKDSGGGFMSAIVQSFLNLVQPHPFPKDLILKIIEDYAQARLDQKIVKEVLLYEVGFLVCLAIGVLYIVLMPVVGLFLACCRCCGHCGGKMYQQQTSLTHCCRKALCCSLFVTTVVILAGNACMFQSNEALKVRVDQSPLKLSNSIDNVHTYFTTLPQQIDFVVKESYDAIQEVTRNLDDIGSQLGKEIQERLRGTMDPVLQSINLLDQETTKIGDGLNELTSSSDDLRSNMDLLESRLNAFKSRISDTLSRKECRGCQELDEEINKLTMDTSFSFSGLDELQSLVNESEKANLQSRIKEMEDYFLSIPQIVSNDTEEVVQNSIQLLLDIEAQISRISNNIPLIDLTSNVTIQLNKAQIEINNFLPQIQRAEKIRWSVCVFLCCAVSLVVLCNILGLILGPLGLAPKADPSKRSGTADCGGNFLMMGAGFSFIFSWLFMVVVVIFFLLGGNVYALVCRPWSSGQLLKFIETPGLVPGLNIGPSLGLESNLTIIDIYRDCEKNRPVWTTLRLHEIIDLEDVLNVSKYTQEVEKNFDKVKIGLSSVTLLSPEVQNQLRSISTISTNFNRTSFTEKMKTFSNYDLDPTADQIDRLAGYQRDANIRRQLESEARSLRRVQSDIEKNILPQMESINSIAESLESTADNFNGTVEGVLSNVGAAQDFLNTNTTQIVKTESRRFLDCQLEYFTAYANWASTTLTQQVGRCGPVAGAMESVEVILCGHVVEYLNAFWFSLGWCMAFFVPSIIFSIKLAKYYRRMKSSDVYDNELNLAPIPPFQTKSI